MTDRAPGLGRRLGRVFLLQATLISLAAIIGVYAAGTTIEEVLIRRALEEEADPFLRHDSPRSPHFPVPVTSQPHRPFGNAHDKRKRRAGTATRH